MRKSWFPCTVIGGIIVFIWGMLSWMVLPWHSHIINNFTNQNEVARAIRDNAPESGVYFLPTMVEKRGDRSIKEIERERVASQEIFEEGPLMFTTVRLEGKSPLMVGNLVISLCIQFAGAFLITWLLMQTKGLSYMNKVWFVTCVALIAGILCYLPYWNWIFFSTAYTLVSLLDLVVGWFLGGLAIAKFAHTGKTK